MLQREQDLTHQVLKNLRDTPNEHVASLTHEIESLSHKLGPMMDKVERAQKNIELARATHGGSLLSQHEMGPIGMLSKMGGRMIHYYSDDLTEMLLDDILADTVIEMNKLEGKQRNKEVVDESKGLAANILKHIVDYQSEEHLVQTRWAGEKAAKIARPSD